MVHFNGATDATPSAPTSGTYASILMHEPVGLSTSYPTIDSSTLNLTGLIYLPRRKLTANSTSNLSSSGLNMVLSTLTLNSTNWTIAPGAASMGVPRALRRASICRDDGAASAGCGGAPPVRGVSILAAPQERSLPEVIGSRGMPFS